MTFAELAAPVKQADGVLKCEKMVLGEADASGRRSPVGSGEFFTVPCDLVISAVGEQVDDALMAANGIELDKKGRPAFQTNVDGVYAAGDLLLNQGAERVVVDGAALVKGGHNGGTGAGKDGLSHIDYLLVIYSSAHSSSARRTAPPAAPRSVL